MTAHGTQPREDSLQGLVPSRARYTGWVDLASLQEGTPVDVRTESHSSLALSSPGLKVVFKKEAAIWEATATTVLVALGRPMLRGRAASPRELVDLFETTEAETTPIGGRHALIVVDRRRRAVRLRTDRFGVIPVCWRRVGSRVAFSERADCVLGEEDRAIDLQSLFNYAYFHVIPAPRTIFRETWRLEPASELLATNSDTALASTWLPSFSHQRAIELDKLSDAFRNAIRDAVAFEADSPNVGCFLSGGTDSSTVAGTLKQITGRAATFSIGFEQAGYDEMAYARLASSHFGTEHHEHYVTPRELVETIPLVASHYDQPFGNSSSVPAYICAKLAREGGVDKLLAGDGGDELFGGNLRYAKQRLFEAWWSLPGFAQRTASSALSNTLARRAPLLRKAASYVEQARVPMPARMETYNLLLRFGPTHVFTPEFLELVDKEEPPRLQAQVFERNGSAPFIDRMLAYDWRFTLAYNDLPKVCGTTDLAGVSAAFPLLDDRLVDLSTQLAPRDKVRGLQLRHFFKESLKDFLPTEIIRKKKHGFGLPVGPWLVSNAQFRSLAHDSLSALVRRHLVRAQLVEELFSNRLGEHAGYYGELIWILMMLEQWMSSHRPAWEPD